MPIPKFSILLEGYDTRKFLNGRLLWYCAIAVTNLGGRTFTVNGLEVVNKGLPLAVLAKNYQLYDIAPAVAVYLFDRPTFEQLVDADVIDRFIPKTYEELQALNIPIPPGETKALYILFAIDKYGTDADTVFLNAAISTNVDVGYSLSKFIRISRSN